MRLLRKVCLVPASVALTLLVQVGCTTPGDSCGCAPAPTGSLSGRLTDAQGRPLAGVELQAVQVTGTGPSPMGLYPSGRAITGPDGAYTMSVPLGRHRILGRPLTGATTFLPRLGPEVEVKEIGSLVSVPDLALTPAVPSELAISVEPIHGPLQEDSLTLSQVFSDQGVDYVLMVATGKPSLSGTLETLAFPKQPPGSYTLFLSRSETTGTHAQTGTAKAAFTLVEGLPAQVPLLVK